MAESQYVLRGKKNKAPMIYTIIVLSIMGLTFILYATYAYLGYIRLNNITEPGIADAIDALGTLFTEDSLKLPITFEVIQEVLIMQVRDIWWVYVGIALAIFLMITSRNPNDFRGVEYGSARWANEYELSKFKDETGIPCGEGFYLTTTQKRSKKYIVPDNLNELVIGGSGAGKSFRKIKPDIIQLTGSYIVTDPSGELYRDMANYLKKNGYKVRVLNLNDITLSNSYNPFKYLENEQDVTKLATMFIENSSEKGEKGDFWTAAARKLLNTIMLYLYHADYETKTFNRVVYLLASIEFENNKISENCEFAKCIKRHQLDHHTTSDAVSIMWNSLKTSPPETFGSISETLSTKLQLWTYKDVDILTSEDEMDFDDIGVHKTAIFVIQPAADMTYRAIANIFFRQLFSRLQYIAELKYNNRLPLLVSFELDEFANIGTIPDFDKTLAVIRKYNLRICIVLQALAQLKVVYDENVADEIIGNCVTLTFLGTTDKTTTEFISTKLGKTTARVDTQSHNTGNQGGGSKSESYVARDLLSPDEVPKAIHKGVNGKAIVIVGTNYPFYIDKFDLTKHPRYLEIGSDRNPEQMKNNANLTEDFTPIREKRYTEYEEKQKKAHLISEAVENGEYSGLTTFEQNKAEENNKKLRDLFEASNGVLMAFNDAVIDPTFTDEDFDDIEDG